MKFIKEVNKLIESILANALELLAQFVIIDFKKLNLI